MKLKNNIIFLILGTLIPLLMRIIALDNTLYIAMGEHLNIVEISMNCFPLFWFLLMLCTSAVVLLLLNSKSLFQAKATISIVFTSICIIVFYFLFTNKIEGLVFGNENQFYINNDGELYQLVNWPWEDEISRERINRYAISSTGLYHISAKINDKYILISQFPDGYLYKKY